MEIMLNLILGDVYVNGSIILKWILKECQGMDWSWLGLWSL